MGACRRLEVQEPLHWPEARSSGVGRREGRQQSSPATKKRQVRRAALGDRAAHGGENRTDI